MSVPNSIAVGRVTLEQLTALNDEIAALVRAGVPLERGLADLGRDMPGRLGRLATMLAERTARGESLGDVLAEPTAQLPPLYRAVVEAGLRAGRLPAALESLAGSIRRLADTRRTVALAALYPLLVLALASALLAFFTAKVAPQLFGFFQAMRVPGRSFLGGLAWCGRWADYWGPSLPLLTLLLAVAWWYWSSHAAMATPGRSARLLGWLPWMGATLRWSQAANFAEIMALLVQNGVPLDEAVALAAESIGDPRLSAAAAELAAAIQRGEGVMPAGGAASRDVLPPLLRWLMTAGGRHGALLPALRHAAQTYHQRAQQQANMASVFLPILLTVAIGGSATLLYALTLFLPYTFMLKAMGHMP